MNEIRISLGAFFEQLIELKAVFLGKKDVFSAVSFYQGMIHPTGHMQSGFPRHKGTTGLDSKKCNSASLTPFPGYNHLPAIEAFTVSDIFKISFSHICLFFQFCA
ncbi:MAG: hypothetical protein KKE57_07995 [Proteobacteria bacterium]|nr:hypothetical protein [Pseudomonadota bacterium]